MGTLSDSDVLDTTLNVQMVRAADILIADLQGLLAALQTRAEEHGPQPPHPLPADRRDAMRR